MLFNLHSTSLLEDGEDKQKVAREGGRDDGRREKYEEVARQLGTVEGELARM